jgi:hypothetical protein
MLIKHNIKAAEERYRQPLENFFLEKWGRTKLYSHAIDHHRRVWHYASLLLTENEPPEACCIHSFAEKLIIACYLHDLGMAIDPGFRHGRLSKNFCSQFLNVHGLKETEFADVLEAIEFHDDKDYEKSAGKSNLLTFLTVADDLDAFGYIGIYRYMEIYLLRGIPKNEICSRAMENAAKRYLHFRSVFKENPALVEKHRKRFEILNIFFKELATDGRDKILSQGKPSENLRIIEFLTYILSRNINPENIFQFNLLPENDTALNSFFRSIVNETEELKQQYNY